MRIRQLVSVRTGFPFVAVVLLAGCGMPGPPQPPSLKLAKLVEDLDAQRSGRQVVLRWSGASENTDKTKVEAGATVVVRRRISEQGSCDKVGKPAERAWGRHGI